MASLPIQRFLDRRPPVPTPLKENPAAASLPRVDSDAIIGIEVEVEQAQFSRDSLSRVWDVKEDGSLRNSGLEFVTHPIKASQAPIAIHNLFLVSLDQKQCAFSLRTSIHVHINMMDCTVMQMTNLVLLYSLFEPLFYKYAGRGRWKNIYCVPITETNMLNGLIQYGARVRWQKYTGLNLGRLLDIGTVEFRHLAGMHDPEKIVNWIQIITTLLEYVKRTPEEELQSRIKNLPPDTDMLSLLREVFGPVSDLFEVTDTSSLTALIPIVKTAFVEPGKTRSKLLGPSDYANYLSITRNAAVADLLT